MKFYIWWFICILFALWSVLEKLVATVNGGSMISYYSLIFAAAVSWLCAYFSWAESHNKDNPF